MQASLINVNTCMVLTPTALHPSVNNLHTLNQKASQKVTSVVAKRARHRLVEGPSTAASLGLSIPHADSLSL